MKLSKAIIISLLFYLLVPLAFESYRIGVEADILVFIVSAPLIFIIIWLVTNRWWMVLLFGFNYAASYFLYSMLSTFLYYRNISNDKMTLVVGFGAALLGAIIAMAISVILTVVKAVILRRRNKVSEINEMSRGSEDQ
ncbi:MAG: hypothetical protein IKI41_00460 [Clostridia bacterium]|nr:hypothetical protein [Clostridia bacterium]